MNWGIRICICFVNVLNLKMTPIMAERLLLQVTGGRLLVSITVETVQAQSMQREEMGLGLGMGLSASLLIGKSVSCFWVWAGI